MQDDEFFKMFNRSGVKMGIIGFFILLFAVFIMWIAGSDADPEMEDMSTSGKAILWSFAGLFALVGLLLIGLPVVAVIKQRNGKHLLSNAIRLGDQSYILWFYEHITEVRSGPAKNTNHRIWMMARDRKQYSMEVKKARVQEVLAYLQLKFPTAMIGYTKEMEAAFDEQTKRANK